MLTRVLPTNENPDAENYVIVLKPTGVSEENGEEVMIGEVGISSANDAGAYIQYGLLPEYQGKGYGTEALQLLIRLYWSVGRRFLSSFVISKWCESLIGVTIWVYLMSDYIH